MAHVFISYASADRVRIRPLVEALQAAGLKVWWDRQIAQGQNFGRVIEEALERASCVVVAWTEASVESEWVCNEASEARKLGKLVPVLLDNVEMPLEFRHLHVGSLVGWNGNSDAPQFQETLSAVRRHTSVAPAAHVVSDTSPPTPRQNSLRWILAAALLLAGAGVLLIGLKQVGWIGASSTVEQSSADAPPAASGVAEPTIPQGAGSGVKASGGVPGDNVNLLLAENGARLLQASEEGWAAAARSKPAMWVATKAGFGVFELGNGQPTRFDTVGVFVESTNEINLRRFDVLVGDQSPNGPFRRVAQIDIPNVRDMQNPYHLFPIGAVTARYVKIELAARDVGPPNGYLGTLQLLNRGSAD